MQIVGSNLTSILSLATTTRDLIELYEFYEPGVNSLNPAHAAMRLSNVKFNWSNYAYERQVVQRGDIERYMSGKFNAVSLTLSNIDRAMGSWVSEYQIEGMRLVIRIVSRSVADDSLVIFVGRVEKPFDVDDKTVVIQAKQDLGSIDSELPKREYSHKCPLKFKGAECQGDEAVAIKDAAWRTATACDKSWDQCNAYGNTDFFQGFRFSAVTGTFKLSVKRGGAGGAVLGLIGLGNKKVKRQWTSQEDTPLGTPIALVFGRGQLEAVNLRHADTGQYLAGVVGFCEGPIDTLTNVRNTTNGWAETFQAYAQHRGEYGSQSEQEMAGFFASSGDRYSHLCYAEYTIKGNNPDTGDSAPVLVGVVRGLKIPAPDNSGDWINTEVSDNPVAIARWIITNERALGHPEIFFDDDFAWKAWQYCNEPLVDTSKGEQLYLPNNLSSQAGVDWKRYRSTGLVDTKYWRYVLGLDATPPDLQETTYNYFDPTSFNSTIAASTFYRKRYTASVVIKDKVKAIDFLFKSLLPSCRGYLVTGPDGKIRIKIEQPALSMLVRSNISAGVTAIPIEDVNSWQDAGFPSYVLLGVGLPTSEVLQVTAKTFSTAGNSVTTTASATGGVTLTASGATLSGGSTSTPATGTYTVGGTPAAGNTITATIDGVAVTYTLQSGDTTGTTAAMLTTAINSNATLKRYLLASWDSGTPTVVTITARLGSLTTSTATTQAHNAAEQILRIDYAFASSAQDVLTRGNIVENSFRWPLGSRQTSYNQFVMRFQDALSDYEEIELRENDFDHQARTGKVNKLDIDGSVIDNYHQADRILQMTRYKYRNGDFFCAWASRDGTAMLIEEGDIVVVNNTAMPGASKRNVPLRIEEIRISPDFKTSFVGRVYTDLEFIDTATTRTVPLVTNINYGITAPPTPGTVTLTQPQTGTIRGTFTFGDYIGKQSVIVEVKKAGSGTWERVGIEVRPDASGNGAFEITGLPPGSTQVRLVAVNQYGKESGANTPGTISVSNVYILTVTETDASPSISADTIKFPVDTLVDLGGGDAQYKPLSAVEFIIDEGGNVLSTGQKGHLEIPFAGTIESWSLFADQSGSIVVDIWKDVYANFPPTAADSITASAKPTLSSVQKNQSSTLTGWTTTIAAGDVLAFNVDSVTTVTRVTVVLKIRRT